MFWLITKGRLTALAAFGCAVTVGVCGLALSGRKAVSTAAGTGNWGLHFSQAGQPPMGNATAEALKAHNAYYMGNPEEKTIYITFDAGYENGHTATLLDTLKKHNAPAAFFVVGHYLESAPELVQRMVAEGHMVGNHTYHHPDMAAIVEREAFQRELTQVEELYRQVTGQEMAKIYRPPQGKYSEQNLQTACELGYSTFFWSLAYVDWYVDKQPTREQALDKLTGRIHPGAVVLLHSTSATNAQVLDEVLTAWEKLGYRFGVLTELCGE